MSDQNRPQQPGQPNPQHPAGNPAGPHYGPPGSQGPGQPGYGQQPGGQQPGFGSQQPGFGQQGNNPAGPPSGFGQRPSNGPPPPAQGFGAGTAGAQAGQFGAQPGQSGSQPGPGQPAGWGAPPPPQAKPGGGLPKVPLIIGGAVVLVIALVFGLSQLNRGTPNTGGPPGGPSSQQPGTGAGSAKEAVQKYFDSLAASDPDAIFSLVRDDLPDRTFLTKEVMTAAAQAAPITNLQLTEGEVTSYSAEVSTTYSINSRTVTETMRASQRDGRWYLSRITAKLSVRPLNPSLTELSVGGVKVPTDAEFIDVFPGGYALTSSSPNFKLAKDELIIESLSASSAAVYEIDTTLSDAGLRAFKAATKKLVDNCRSPGSLKNAACGINFRQPPGATIKNKITCTPSGTNSIEKMKPTVDPDDETVRASLSVTYDCRMVATNGSRYKGDDSLVFVYGTVSGSTWKVSAVRP